MRYGSNTDVTTGGVNVLQRLNIISATAASWNLLNIDNCAVMRFSQGCREWVTPNPRSVYIFSIWSLKFVNSHKDSRVTVDKKLNFSMHIPGNSQWRCQDG